MDEPPVSSAAASRKRCTREGAHESGKVTGRAKPVQILYLLEITRGRDTVSL